MKLLLRWCKFSAVGIVGFLVQLASVALLSRMLPGHPLLVTALGVEVTLLHNFIWHLNYTWRDRRLELKPHMQLLRFQMSNGAVSMFGNLAGMSMLLRYTHIPIILSSIISILGCALINFYIAECWAFETRTKEISGT